MTPIDSAPNGDGQLATPSFDFCPPTFLEGCAGSRPLEESTAAQRKPWLYRQQPQLAASSSSSSLCLAPNPVPSRKQALRALVTKPSFDECNGTKGFCLLM